MSLADRIFLNSVHIATNQAMPVDPRSKDILLSSSSRLIVGCTEHRLQHGRL